LLLDDGAGGAFAAIDEDVIANKHYLKSHTVTFAAEDLGKVYRYKLKAHNEIGEVESTISNQLLAGVPGKPDDGPSPDPNETGPTQIKVTWLAPADNGGDEITSYSLEIDDGQGSDFAAVIGLESPYLLLYYTVT